jgi:hypothetical protein
MNIDLTLLTKLFGTLTKPYPARDWLFIVLASGLLAALGFIVAAYLFLGVQTGSIVDASVAPPRAPIPVTKEAIQKVLETYQARAAGFANKSFPAVELSDPRSRAARK